MNHPKEQHGLEWLPEPISKAIAGDCRHVDRRQLQAMSQGVLYRFSPLLSAFRSTRKTRNICAGTPNDIACDCLQSVICDRLRSGCLRLPAIELVTTPRKCST
jgi:hypothetical protein